MPAIFPMQDSEQYVSAMRQMLSEINQEKGSSLELHPLWPAISPDPRSLYLGFKVHSATANPSRILSLLVDARNFEVTSGQLTLNDATRKRIQGAAGSSGVSVAISTTGSLNSDSGGVRPRASACRRPSHTHASRSTCTRM